ncbi:hypothetical protein PspLS_11003 [Pyricularia sp. CBS 133598]|nr:hypothetical protein PspLS_11003 [Pyricularia sp. CBS 133598]
MGSSQLDLVSYYDDWFFTTFQSTPSCPGFGLAYCPAPQKACARDPTTGRRYCCDGARNKDSVCWALATDCKSDGSTSKCGGGGSSWCCLAGTEKCTETKNQINICWSTGWDPLNNVTEGDLAKVYSSLSSAQPSATSLRFDLGSIIRATATATPDVNSGRALDDPALATTTGPSGPLRPTGPPDGFGFRNGVTNQNELSGGAIAGIVVGVLAGVAMIVAGALWFVRQERKKQLEEHVCSPEAGAVTAAAALVPAKDETRVDAGTSSGSEHGPAEMESAQMHHVTPDRGTSGEGHDSIPLRAIGRDSLRFQGGAAAAAAHELPPENQQPAELPGDSIPRVMHEMPAEDQAKKSLS